MKLQLVHKFAHAMHAATGTLEVAAGAFLGGAMEGKTAGKAIGPVPLNLLAGVVTWGAGHFGLVGDHSHHLQNLGDGMIGSYAAATGYAWGKRWHETGKMFGHGAPAMPLAGPAVQGELSPAQMDQIVERMRAAAQAA